MAERRMFTKKIVDSDAFLDMPLSTQALYFHLNMRADDDGFINNPRKIQRMIGASDDDLKLLLAKRFVLGFESGVIVIKHWRMHNLLRKDRYNPTQYQEEYQTLELKENGAYTEGDNRLATAWQPNDNQMATQDSIGKDSIGKLSIDKHNISVIKDDILSPRQLTNEFELIWTNYPRKQGKQNALKAYIKARKSGTSEESVRKGLYSYLKYIQAEKIEPRYIKQGSTWFNQQCWNDSYEITRKPTTKDIAEATDFSEFM